MHLVYSDRGIQFSEFELFWFRSSESEFLNEILNEADVEHSKSGQQVLGAKNLRSASLEYLRESQRLATC